MAQFYMRTEAEAIEDGLMCDTPCEHVDCESWRTQTQETCRYCGKPAAGLACFIEQGRLVHALCVMDAVDDFSGSEVEKDNLERHVMELRAIDVPD